MVQCRKCAYVLDEGDLPERCPNCGTPTRAPAGDEPGRALAPRKTSSGTPLASIRRASAPLAAAPPGGLPTRRPADEPAPPRPPAAPEPAGRPTAPASATAAGSAAEPAEDDLLPAPVPSTRPFTLPRLVSEQRITVPATLEAGRDLENSAELDLPNPNDASAVHPPVLLAPPLKTEDLDVDLADAEARQAPPRAQPIEELPLATPTKLPRLPPPRSRRIAVAAPVPAAPAPTAAAYAGLIGLAAALVALWWVYFSRGAESSLLASTSGHDASDMLNGPRAAERRAAFAAHLDTDSVEGYLGALALAEQQGDDLDRAEAALRIDLRYGPDPVRAAQAAAWLDRAAIRDKARADRVRALAALTRGDLAAAAERLERAADPWADLYRGFVAYQAGDFAAAAEAASQALSQRPDDRAARWLALAAELAADRRASLDPLRAEADGQPERLTLQTLLIDALIARGRFTEARKRLEGLTRPPGLSDAHYARVLLQNARVSAASVEVSRSLYWAEEAMRATPNDPAVLRAALRVLIEADELARAQQGLGALLRASPQDPEAHVLQAELALRAGNESAAARAIDRLAAQPRTLALANYFRGRLALAGGRIDEAAQHFQAAASADPPHVGAAIEHARLRARAGAPDGLAALDRLFEDRQRDPGEQARADLRALALARANLLAEAGKRDQAIAALDAALARDPDDNAAQLRRGVLALEAGRVDAGRVDLLAVYERTGGFPGLVGPMSRLYIRSGELKQLEAMLASQVNDARAPEEVVLAVAQLRLAQDSVEAADLMADNVLLRNPGSWEAHLIKSRVLLARGELQLALAELRMARPKQPDAEVELTAGKIHERSGRPQDALAAYRKAHQLAPTLHEATFLYGRMLLQLGRPQDAITELSAVTRATESFPAAFLALGQAFRERGNLDEAHRQFQRASVLAPNLAEAQYWLGRCEAERQQFAAAQPALQRAVRSAEPDAAWLADAYLWLGRAAEAVRDPAAARAAYESYLRLAPAKGPGRTEAERQLAQLGRAP